MPYGIKWTKKGIRWKFFGIVTSAEALESNLAIYGDSRFDSIRYQIADFTEVEELRLDDKDLKKIAFLDKAAARSNPRISVAIIAPGEALQQILTDYAKYSHDTPWKTKLFETTKSAEDWIEQLVEQKF